ncbi:TPD1 protein homolog 1A-like [Phragmites australis]|uniref:TPD1 protein homolog 1A-like n=1 Tax=Phragmites australis TaxID=29695 RepID=UPI002D796928|nr:TPD1 protein homolog 1A-like [Phragmites australis]
MAWTANATFLLVLAALICCHALTGNAQFTTAGCQLSDIHVSTVRTGNVVGGQPEYRVTIENRCSCPQNGVRVHCAGLPSTEPVDESKIRTEDGGVCLVNDGMNFSRGSPVTFTYAWKMPQEFKPAMAVSRCGYPPSSSRDIMG